MNISQLKAFLGNRPEHLGGDNNVQNQLRESGLRQAIGLQNSFVSLRSDQFSSSAALGVRIYSNALSGTLEVNNQKPDFSAPKEKEVENSLFDFDEVAKNVLNFVGGAIKNAKNSGADEDELNKLFDQASSGVLRGIKLAEKDLLGFLNDEISNGIRESKSLIDAGIEELKRNIFNPDESTNQQSEAVNSAVESVSISSAQRQQGELRIRTRDGDEVNLTFEDFEQFEVNQRQILAQKITDSSNEAPIGEPTASQATGDGVAAPLPPGTENQTEGKTDADENKLVQATEIESEGTEPIEQNAVFYQESSLSFSLTGELDKEELEAIGKLVVDANELASEFFNGDIEKAFTQALELGFDEQELSGFALQLTKVESTQVIKTYETVSRFDSENENAEDPVKAVKPVSDYLDKLLTVIEGSRLQLENNKAYENVVNELINKLGDEVATPDLISAINRFNDFNQKLVNNLPIGFQP